MKNKCTRFEIAISLKNGYASTSFAFITIIRNEWGERCRKKGREKQFRKMKRKVGCKDSAVHQKCRLNRHSTHQKCKAITRGPEGRSKRRKVQKKRRSKGEVIIWHQNHITQTEENQPASFGVLFFGMKSCPRNDKRTKTKSVTPSAKQNQIRKAKTRDKNHVGSCGIRSGPRLA